MPDSPATIDDQLAAWIGRQPLFFVATAPLAADGHVNCSPKGRDTLRVLGPREVAYLDLGGSGIETVAHLRENGRIAIMFCAFSGPPRIVRLHGQGTPVFPGDADFSQLLARFPVPPSPPRSVVRVALNRVAKSCGYGVPLLDYRGDRRAIENYVRGKSAEELRDYLRANNVASIDGLPGLRLD